MEASSKINYKLRDYQSRTIELTRKAFSSGNKKVLCFLATGAGKGLVMAYMANEVIKKGGMVITVVKRRQVVIQTAANYEKYFGIKSSMIMAERKIDPYKKSQICSIDTINRRILKGEVDFLRGCSLVITDEMQDSTADSYQDFYKFLGDKFHCSFSATPFPVGKKVHSFWDCVVKPIETHELRDQGFLTDAKVYVPIDIHLENIKMSCGDYAKKELSEKMQDMKIIGDVVENYKKYGENKPAICFCVDKAHSMLIKETFLKIGVSCAHIDESTKQKDRDEIIKRFKKGEIKIISNVLVLSVGVDIPSIEICLMARPTKSESLYVQAIGRALRPYRQCGKCKSSYDNSLACPVCGYDRPSYIKTHAIIIDFGNNTSRFGLPFDVRYAVIKEEEKKKDTEKKLLLVKTCKKCFMVYDAKSAKCPNCGGAETKERIYKTESGELILYNEFDAIKETYLHLCRLEIQMRWKPAAKYFKLFEKHGEKCMKFQKEFNIPAWIPKIYQQNLEKKSGEILR